jgi:hypothetical protein
MRALRSVRIGVVAVLALSLLGARARAAVIAWSGPTNISGDADVSTAGTLLGALNIGAQGVPNTTVNGVTFVGVALTGNSVTSGNFTFTASSGNFGSSNFIGSAAAPFSNLSAAYQSLLGTGGGGFANIPLTLTMNGLTVGKTYQFEWWWNVSAFPAGVAVTTAAAGTSVTLNPNTTNTIGGLGQFANGTFVADAATQSITFVGPNDYGLNGLQLRDLGVGGPGGGGAAVPLPAAVWTGLIGGAAVARRTARARRGG